MIFGSDSIRYICRPPGERFNPKYQLPTVKHGGGYIIMWEFFSGDGIGPIHHIIGIMGQYGYKDIIEVMLTHAKDKMRRGWIFQQGNYLKHTAGSIKTFFDHKKINVLVWPS